LLPCALHNALLLRALRLRIASLMLSMLLLLVLIFRLLLSMLLFALIFLLLLLCVFLLFVPIFLLLLLSMLLLALVFLLLLMLLLFALIFLLFRMVLLIVLLVLLCVCQSRNSEDQSQNCCTDKSKSFHDCSFRIVHAPGLLQTPRCGIGWIADSFTGNEKLHPPVLLPTCGVLVGGYWQGAAISFCGN